MEDQNLIRINKYLSEAGVCSRREADRLIADGRVTIDGKEARTGDRVTGTQDIRLDGRRIGQKAAPVLLLFYKPRGLVCSTVSQGDQQTVTGYLDYPERIYPVGRLDKDSEGLLLMTNQGDLMNQILRAANRHEKEYLVTVNRPLNERFLSQMKKGVPILDTVTRPCRIRRTGECSFDIILTQGLNRQIRRMCEALGYQVRTLKRIRIMNLTLDGLKPGQFRPAAADELAELYRRCYGREEKENP